ncbi:MAG: glycosyltransferase [Parabacteroides sp.]
MMNVLSSYKRVSVVMCTYNGERYLREQLDSIVHQTYPIHELIVQDDCSQDETIVILHEYARHYPFMKVFQNESSLGINQNFLTAIQRATGDFIALSDQDDVWDCHKIEWQLALMGDALFSCGFSKPFVSGQDIQIHFDGRIPNLSPERLIYASAVAGHTQIIRKDLLGKIPNLDQGLQVFMYDQLFQVVAALYGSISFCDRILVHQRRYASAATYTRPVNCQKTVWNGFRTLQRTWSQYRSLKKTMQAHFVQIHSFLLSFPEKGTRMKDVLQIAYYQSKGSLVSFLRLICLCVRLRDRIFYVPEKNGVVSLLRAVLFPITCSDYFRYLIKK